jgi:hypothetical protein
VIDTCEVGWMCGDVGAAEERAFRQCVEGVVNSRTVSDTAGGGDHPVTWWGVVPGLGTVRLGVDGYLSLGGSLAKYRQSLAEGIPLEHCSNDALLTAAQCDDTFQILTERVESLFPFALSGAASPSRLDVVYQRRVRSTYETIEALQMAMKQTRKGCTWFVNKEGVRTGVTLNGNAVVRREYDKGLEGGKKEFLNVLRSEEQLRRKAKDFSLIYDAAQRSFNREECRRVINERFLKVAYGGDLDVAPLVAEGRSMMAVLVLRPDLAHVHKASVTRNGHYKMMRQVREFRAQAIPEDLRVPEDAWLSMAA